MEGDDPWQRLLRTALAVLALPAAGQVHVNGPGCVACDLDEEFRHARLVALGDANGWTAGQRRLLDRIDGVLRQMRPPDRECFNPDVLQRPPWQELRLPAAEALRTFGWERAVVRPYVEVSPGVWHRPDADAEPGPGGRGR